MDDAQIDAILDKAVEKTMETLLAGDALGTAEPSHSRNRRSRYRIRDRIRRNVAHRYDDSPVQEHNEHKERRKHDVRHRDPTRSAQQQGDLIVDDDIKCGDEVSAVQVGSRSARSQCASKLSSIPEFAPSATRYGRSELNYERRRSKNNKKKNKTSPCASKLSSIPEF